MLVHVLTSAKKVNKKITQDTITQVLALEKDSAQALGDKHFVSSKDERLVIHNCFTGKHKEDNLLKLVKISELPDKKNTGTGNTAPMMFHSMDAESVGPNIFKRGARVTNGLSYAVFDTDFNLYFCQDYSFYLQSSSEFDPATCDFWSQNLGAFCRAYASADDYAKQSKHLCDNLAKIDSAAPCKTIISDGGLPYDSATASLMMARADSLPIYFSQYQGKGPKRFCSSETAQGFRSKFQSLLLRNKIKAIEEKLKYVKTETEKNKLTSDIYVLENTCYGTTSIALEKFRDTILDSWGLKHDHHSRSDTIRFVAGLYISSLESSILLHYLDEYRKTKLVNVPKPRFLL